MATQYSNVYNVFLNKMSDSGLLAMDVSSRSIVLRRMMVAACEIFDYVCKEDLSKRDDTTEEFEDDVSEESINIITELMLVEWLKQKLYKGSLYETAIGTKDFSIFSPANQLKEIRETYELTKQHSKKLIIDYSYKS